MKYKVGNKVEMKVISTWDVAYKNSVNNLPGKIATIKLIKDGYYHMEDLAWRWQDHEIECLVGVDADYEPIESRFEILDL